jgi:tRNA(Ile)-lysidine synthase
VAALHPAVAAIRGAVRACLPPPGGLLLVACSGGADSLALATAAAFVAPRLGWRAGLVTVDHQLQAGSAERAHDVAEWAGRTGLAPAIIETVQVAGRPGGPEAAARDARYEALVHAGAAHGATTLLLGHTRDDQAETVLLALLRGAGLRGIAGMPARRDIDGIAFLRPLLEISREQCREACAALDLTVWDDPHNSDPVFAVDAAALDDLAAHAWSAAAQEDGSLRVGDLTGLAEAVRTRVLHAWAGWLGVPGSALSHRHVVALDALVMAWHGQGPVYLPGAITVVRRDGMLRQQP